MRKILVALVAAFMFIIAPSAAFAGGSDAPTPYDVRTDGIQLPAPDTFQAHGHVNVRYFDGNGVQQTRNLHFDPNPDHSGAQWIGESFIPWSAFHITEGRITWVQIHGYNQHFGEGGQKPVPVGPQPDPNEETRTTTEYEERETFQCPTDETGYGTVTTIAVTVEVVEERASTISWDGTDWVETWGDWTEVSRTDLSSETIEVREMTADEYEDCGLPPTGAPLIGAGIAALALLGVGGALALRRR